ncbi:hypothetical protein ACFE04_003892 [Oxalis oulophora]
MASYRPFPQQQPPQSNYPQNQAPPPLAPLPPPGQQQQQPPPPWNPSSNNTNYHYASSRQPQNPPPPQYSYPQPPPPPPPDSSYPPPPPPAMYYPSSQYGNQYSHQPPPPPPPSSPPPSSSMPPPPPPPGSPPPPPPKVNDRGTHVSKNANASGGRREHRSDVKQQRPPLAPQAGHKANGDRTRRVETEEERRIRKKREYEKEKQRQILKESQNKASLTSGKGHGSISGSKIGERRATPLVGAENRLKKPTTFLCKLKFRNELPDPSAQPKLTSLKREKDHYSKYTITSLEKIHKPQLFVEPDLGIPLDLLDLSVYNRPKNRQPLDPEDEELLRDDESVTPVKKDGIRKKDRPTDKGVSWLVKTQYISSLSTDSARQSLTEKQAKELRDSKGGRNILDNLNNRQRQIKEIEATFKAAKSRPIHSTNKNLRPVEVLPLFPDFERLKDKFVVVSFDGAPTADSEHYGKLNEAIRDKYESKAVMKSYVAKGSDPSNPEKFLSYMVPNVDELSKNIYDEEEDVTFSWIREYNWDMRGEDQDDPTTFLVSFDDSEARFAPLPTKLNLKKKRGREGRPNDEVEQFAVPAKVTVRRRETTAVIEGQEDTGVYASSRGGSSRNFGRIDSEEEGLERSHHQDDDQYSGAEDDMSD